MIQENETISVLDTPIQDCDFTMRLQNILVTNDVHYIRQVIMLSEEQILSFNYLGRKSFDELRDFLNRNSLKLIGDIDNGHTKQVSSSYASKMNIESCNFSIRTTNVLRDCKIDYVAQLLVMTEREFLFFPGTGRTNMAEVNEFLHKNGLKFADPPTTDVLEMKIKDCGFETRAENCLVSEKIMYVKELILFTENQLLSLDNLGMKSLNQIKYFLGQHDLTLTSNHIGLLREQTKHGMQLRLAIDDKTSKQVIELWIELNTPLLAEDDNQLMKAKCFLENINRRKAEMNPNLFNQPRVKSS